MRFCISTSFYYSGDKMKKNIFLIGPSGCGKTTIIRSVLGEKLACAGGFVTERIRNGDGSLLGYDMFPAAYAAGVAGYEGRRFLDYSVSPPVSDNEVFRTDGVRLLREAEMYPFALLDEFGGFELIIPQFREALLDVLNSDLPCVGVLKGAPNAQQLRRRLGLGERYSTYRYALEAALAKDSDTLLINVSGYGDRKATEAVRRWGEYYAP